MRPEDSEALISYRLQRAEESLKAAEIMLHNQMFLFAMNRIYYAMFYAVQEALVLSGASFSKHAQVKAYLNRKLIKTGILPIELGRLYNKAFEYRQKFDYVDFAEADQEMVITYLNGAGEFVSAITAHIQKS